MHSQNCFVTLTYGRDQMPPNGSLEYRDYQLFMKRLRSFYRGQTIRFFVCGEYGPLNLRPHYHACLFGIDFQDRTPMGKSGAGAVYYDSPTLAALWSHGRVSVQDLTRETAAYCARYIVDKVTGDAATAHYESVDPATGEVIRRQPEFSRCSLKPGIGAKWFDKYGSDVYPHDFVVNKGNQYQVPKFYDKLKKRQDPKDVVLDRIEFARQERAMEQWQDQTPERLAVREVVHKARVNNLKRDGL